MLTCCDRNGNQIFASQVDKREYFTCPECKNGMILKRGTIKVAHFAHKIDEGCQYGEGESQEHLLAKLQIYNSLIEQKLNVKLEEMFPNNRSDLTIRPKEIDYRPVAIEIQKSHLSILEIKQRTNFYTNEGIPVLWVVLHKYKNYSEPNVEIKTTEQEGYFNNMFGRVFFYGLAGGKSLIDCVEYKESGIRETILFGKKHSYRPKTYKKEKFFGSFDLSENNEDFLVWNIKERWKIA